MKNRGRLLRRTLGMLLAVALLLPLTGPGIVLEASAITKAEIDALKGDASALASQDYEQIADSAAQGLTVSRGMGMGLISA